MKEGFLHYLWSLQYFARADLRTTEGDPVDVFYPGMLNTDAGPDFSNARIRVGGLQWIGSVEIHVQSSGWMAHGHTEDGAYDTVILHVVWHDDLPVIRKDGTRLPTIELKGRVEEHLIRRYRQLMTSSFIIPCQKRIAEVEPVVKSSMMARALTDRLDRKAREVLALLELNGGDWEETTYQLLAGAFGFKINRDPFLQLARALPLRLLRKHDQPIQREALLFGQAGLLESPTGDAYYLDLRKEYQVLCHKYQLATQRLTKAQWRFLRLRPQNFPTLRIAQFCAVIGAGRPVFATLMESRTLNALKVFFDARPSPYWAAHFLFSKSTSRAYHELGLASVQIIIINTVTPLMAAYSRHADLPEYLERAIGILEELPAEVNGITQRWTDLGMTAQNAGDAQGQIELFNTFCQGKRCLDCGIGAALMRPANDEPATPHP